MTFVIERLDLTDADGLVVWPDCPPTRRHGHAEGSDAREALVGVVACAGDVRLDVTQFTDGQGLVIARSGKRLYALRAVPRGTKQPLSRDPPFTG